jgi:tetratricopeptide (TPR) repeat protein
MDARCNALVPAALEDAVTASEEEPMTTAKKRILLVIVALVSFCIAAPARAQELGVVHFPNSGSKAAQPSFIEGIKELYSFQFDEAALAFQKTERIDPNFALAYWGEAMSHNHPLWAEVDVDKARQALEKLAPTRDARIAKARTPQEKAYLSAVDQLFYTPGDKLARDNAYSKAMAGMHDRWPDDNEIATLYALSLLGTVRPGDTGFRRQALAASLCLKVFQENPQHPGAAHFIIHSFDDPDHAILALPAARAYARIAPAAAHALHMPSHIFVQLGMWPEVAASNTVAYQAAEDVIARLHTPEGREDFHTLSWLEYANLMMGKFDDAQKNIELGKQAVDRNPGNAAIEQSYLGMRARYILETGKWEKIPLPAAAPPPAGTETAGAAPAQPSMPNMPGMPAATDNASRYSANGAWVFIAGFSAAKMGDPATADQAAMQLHAMAERTASAGNAYAAKPFTIMEKEVTAAAQLARGQKDDAIHSAAEAADVEATLSAPSGPPDPIKPAEELYGEVLLEAGQPAQAAAAFEKSLQRTPNRTASVQGLAQATRDSSNLSTAR